MTRLWTVFVAGVLAGCATPGPVGLRAIVASVYDGDTLTALIYQGPGDWSLVEKVRLKEVWAPEIKGAERTAGLTARDALRAKVLGREVLIVPSGKRSAGRMVADVYLHGQKVP